ncbi:MAG: LuxR C-terminal-related transcriptional regulator [Panacagrimonas sp.]
MSAALEQDSVRPKLTVIVAPVGYGKTVLMSTLHDHLRARNERCFWTALDDRDKSIHRALCLLEVLSYRPGEQQHPTQALFRGDEPIENRINTLIEAAGRYPRPMTVFVDNLEFCTDSYLGRLLDRLVFETPPSVRFVFSSTSELPLNLAKAKLAGLVRHIGYSELSLECDLVAELLGPDLSAAVGKEGLRSITRQTEGWPAAVRMLQIVLSESPQPLALLEQFRGSDEDLSALLQRQVLSGFTRELREFLLDIANLRTFCVDLCAHVTGSKEVLRHWQFLINRNVFVIPVDRNRTWYRLHGLFRDYLINQSQHSLGAARRREVLTRAAEWCDRGGYWRDAIDYALEGEATGVAVVILERTAAAFVRNLGDTQQYIAWAQAVHARQQALGWDAEYWYIWALCLNQRYDEGRKQMEGFTRQIDRALATGTDVDHLNDLKRRLEIIRICIDVFTDRLAEAHRKACQWLENADADDPFDVVVANCAQSIYFASAHLFVEAREAAQTAQSASFQSGSAYAKGWIVLLNALPSILEGNYSLIYPELSNALKSLRTVLGDGAGMCGTISFLAAECAVEMGLDEEARTLTEFAMRSALTHGLLDVAARGLGAAVKLWTGAANTPVRISELREIAGGYPPRLAFMFACSLTRRLLRLGQLDEAKAEAARHGICADKLSPTPRWSPTANSRDLHQAALIDLRVAFGLARYGDAMIAEELKRARAEGRMLHLVELTLTQMVLALHEGKPDAAHRHLTSALSIAASRSIVRPFNDHAQTIATLVEETKPSSWGFALAQERSFFADICRRLPISNRALQEKLEALNIEAHMLDPLTRRQVELLGLLDAGLSNQQIADRITVSLATVKGHLQNLYAKLSVSSRSAALAKARVLKLL